MSRAEPFTIRATDEQLSDLKRRIAKTRWPDRETVDDWSQGIPLAYVKEIANYWLERYDWRAREARINTFPQFRMPVGDLNIHFIHKRSPHANATPLVMTHGWPGSILEFLKVIDPLSNPEAHSGQARDAFHVVCPSLPGYGYSDKPTRTGFGLEKIAELWDQLMVQLGYTSYIAQGGDWGSGVTASIGVQNKGHCRAIHLNQPFVQPLPESLKNPNDATKQALAKLERYQQWDSGYAKQQSTRPQTLGYGLTDSPVAQAAWIIEKFWSWTDCSGHPENILTRDELLDNVMLYWLPATGVSAARLYWESFNSIVARSGDVTLPMGWSMFPKEIITPPREWVEARFKKLVYWSEAQKGGHFAAFEQPALFVEEIRRFHDAVR